MHESSSYFLYFVYKLVLSSLCPRRFRRLQILAILSFLTVVLSCVVNFFVPVYAQKIVDSLVHTVKNKQLDYRWDLVIIFMTLKVFQGFGALSIVTALQQIMWLPVEQHVRVYAQAKFFRHVHSMSLRWMMDAKLGEILGSLERGTESIASTIEHLLYSVMPTFGDIIISIVYISIKFGWMYSSIVGSQVVLYIIFTALAIENSSKYQNYVNVDEDDLRQKALESVINYETVKCFGNEDFERDRYSESLKQLQRKKYKIGMLTSFAQTVQQGIVCTGLLACVLLMLDENKKGTRFTPGEYVLLTSYLAQLYGPLNYLAGYYSELRVNIAKAESMMNYFKETPEIRDSSLTNDLYINRGDIEFKDVCFISDSGKGILQNISFVVRPNTTVALVGSSGSGKTSIARLLLRLFDPTQGQISVDGIDVKDVTLKSLRKSIGIIPQDIGLFHDTIRNNIRYDKPNASDKDVEQAAKLAQIHDRIITFPKIYDTIVGERGTRLSGGERQRVAIARTILKNPKILILDEATSALDAETEKMFSRNFPQIMQKSNMSNDHS